MNIPVGLGKGVAHVLGTYESAMCGVCSPNEDTKIKRRTVCDTLSSTSKINGRDLMVIIKAL